MRTITFAITLLLCLAVTACYKPQSESYPLGTAENPLVMAFVPSTEAEKVIDSGDELVSLLTAETGLHFETEMASGYNGIVEAMHTDHVHVAWLPPMAYVFARQRNNDRVILKAVRHGSETYRGQIVVKSDSGIETLEDLKGKRIAFADQTSSSGHLYPRMVLLDAGVDPEANLEIIWAGGHDSAVFALLNDSVDAACCYEDAREKLVTQGFPDILETTKVLAYTAHIPNDNVAVASNLDPELADKITAGLMALCKTQEGQQVLMDLYEIEGLVPAQDSDYDPVRNMASVLELDIEQEVAEGN